MPFVAAFAAGQFIEDIQVSKRGNEATITLELGCPMRFQSDARTQAGLLLEIRVAPLESCRQLGFDGISSELYRPVGGQLAHLTEVEYESLGLGENLLMLHFDRPVEYRVAQRGDLRSLQLIVVDDGRAATQSVVPEQLPPVAAPAPRIGQAPPALPAPRASAADRAPLTQRVREPNAAPDYVINLQSTRVPVAPEVLETLAVPAGRKPYVSEVDVDGERWNRLRIGFFASEQEARGALQGFAAAFPRAWVGRAESDEVTRASSSTFAPGGTVIAKVPPTQESVAVVAAARVTGPGVLGPEGVQQLQTEGREAILNQDYEAAIRVYTRLLQEPGEHRAEAREYLGLARERNGQVAHASAEYRAYLEDYPDGEGARRVRQRLNGLALAAQTPQAPLRKTEIENGSHWDVATGLSQYYRRDVNQFDEDLPEIVSLEALLTDLDMNVRHTGGAVNLLGRVSVGNMHDLIGQASSAFSSPTRISYAYVDANAAAGDWALRVGRQTLRSWGVLGRFDGVHFSYDWAPERRVHFTSGYPVESTRYGVRTYRRFYGAAVDFDHLIGSWDFSTFVNSQTIDGVSDRQAVGFETHYLDDKRSVTSLVDYDYDYGELNTAFVLATWRFDNRLTLTGLVDARVSPVLTTRNALIGQPVATIDELLMVVTEDELHQLARDRTADSTTVTIGFTKPLFERFQINADVTTTEISATVASFGVPAIAGTGRQIYYSTSFVGSGLFGSGDVSVFTLRHGVSDEFTTSQLTWDTRFPVGRRLRLNPRLRLAVWQNVDGRKRETTSPSFRFLLNTREHYRLEAEFGRNDFLRTDLTSRQDSTGNYVNIGYRADF